MAKNPDNTPVYQGTTGNQSKVLAQNSRPGEAANTPGNQQSVSRNATLPLGLGHYLRPGGAGANGADPPGGVSDASLGDVSAPLGDGVGTTTIHPPQIPVGSPEMYQ